MKTLLLSTCLMISSLISGQVYGVLDYEYIAEVQGGFKVFLDTEDWFGYAVEAIGDLNQDGFQDIAVGTIKDDDGGFNHGAVYILFLDANGAVITHQKISDTEGGFLGQLDEWDIFGTSISYLGDMNGDGLVEIGVGAEYDGDGGIWRGAVWILSLNSDGTVAAYTKISDTEGNFLAPLEDRDVFGTDIELLGDFNGDGNQDIAVSARRDQSRGAVYILFLNDDFTVDSYQEISSGTGGFDVTLDLQDYFGGSVANIGDLDGDGVIDLAVGAYRDDDGGSNRGAVYILFMNEDGTVASHQKISDTEGNFDAGFNGNMFFGKSIDYAGDINNDERVDIVVGARGFWGENAGNFGAFFIINLNNDGTVHDYVMYTEGLHNFDGDINPQDSFGFSVSHMYDATADTHSIISGAFADEVGSPEEGSVWTLKLGGILEITEVENNLGLALAPNPTRNAFRLSNIDGIEKIAVYDMSGKQLVAYQPAQTGNYFDVSYLSVGHYLVEVMNEQGEMARFKIIKE
ncbi:T9SS type A sorting domain-containing protein [Aureisphaera galaxeae]|uniref:T9SS type A sorting domain-containing protein n=1 Tax=Aureisphaera galaxeae TaxID=1538023 RepID=UPI0023500F50|nr:T9SS type A sorting domain-containing protein [Aureisphaera galaxeae]MDC8005629.1 T9SS type A sorting domain-containing protein [Aureisphaera galaxeae]